MAPEGLAPPVTQPVTSVGSPLFAIMKTRSPEGKEVLTDGRQQPLKSPGASSGAASTPPASLPWVQLEIRLCLVKDELEDPTSQQIESVHCRPPWLFRKQRMEIPKIAFQAELKGLHGVRPRKRSQCLQTGKCAFEPKHAHSGVLSHALKTQAQRSRQLG